MGFVAACQALTNAWDVPLLTGLIVLVSLTLALMPPRFSLAGAGRAVVAFSAAAGSAWLLALPLWFRAGGRPGVGKNLEPSSAGLDQLTVFGLFLFIAIAWWMASASQRLAGRGIGVAPRWIAGLLLAGRARVSRGALPRRLLPRRGAPVRGGLLRPGRRARGPARHRVPRNGVLPRALHAALLHRRPDEHLLQAVPGGLAPLCARDGGPRLPPADPSRHDRPLAPPRAGRGGAPRRGRLVHERHRRARGRQPSLRRATRAPRSTACATSRRSGPGNTVRSSGSGTTSPEPPFCWRRRDRRTRTSDEFRC